MASTPPATAPTPPEPPPQPVDETVPPQSNGYVVGPDSLPQPNAPAGKSFKFDLNDSKVYPNSTRTITVYVPAAYQADKPACVYIGLDGLGFRAPVVFDNLIAQHAMPVTIGIGLQPGWVNSATPPENPRYQRSLEGDSMTDQLARFILEDVLPAVEKHTTPDGKPILLSHDPNDRAVGGASTGGIGAFNLVWRRPDAFRRAFVSIGTFVGMHGGERFYIEVRKTEAKPIRVFMEDGIHDQQRDMGDWWMSNQTMERALKFAGAQLNHAWGVGTHSPKHAELVFPDAMRWLWQDWPKPVVAGKSGNATLQGLLLPNEDWQPVADAARPEHLAVDPQGGVFYEDQGKTFRIAPEGKPGESSQTDAVFAVGADGRPYGPKAAAGLTGLTAKDMTVRSNGDLYVTAEGADGAGELWLIRPSGEKKRLDGDIKGASGLAFSPDGLWLCVAQSRSRWALSYRVQTDGTVDSRQSYYDFWVPDWADDAGAGSICMDHEGRAYAATRVGVQVFDRNGRVLAMVPLPKNEWAASVCLGGAKFDTLYATCEGKVYARKVNTIGAEPWAAPIKLPEWHPY